MLVYVHCWSKRVQSGGTIIRVTTVSHHIFYLTICPVWLKNYIGRTMVMKQLPNTVDREQPIEQDKDKGVWKECFVKKMII